MLLCLTANHRNASFDLLEKLSIGAPDAATSLVHASPLVDGAVVLATCNRFEAYLEVDDAEIDSAIDSTVEVISEASGLSSQSLRDAVTILTGEDAVGHLFAVSSGLESVIVGEDEISGQVRRALERARVSQTTSSELERVFQRATKTSRGVKSQTSLGSAGRSLVRLALDLASSRIIDWSLTRVLIVGTGQYAATTVAALRDRGATMLSVYSPSGRGDAFGTKHALSVERDLAGALIGADVVITCTASLVIEASSIVGTVRRLIIDLGLPRNVSQDVRGLPGIELLDLETISLHAPIEALTASSDAPDLVGSAAAEYYAERSVEPAIVAMRSHISELVEAEIARARRRGAGDETEAALRHLAGVLMHTPSARARELASEGRAQEFVDGLAALYSVEAELPATDARPGLATA